MAVLSIDSEDVFLLCSDGFWEHLKPEEIADSWIVPKAVGAKFCRPWSPTRGQSRRAKADNASVILAGFDEPNALQAPQRGRGLPGAFGASGCGRGGRVSVCVFGITIGLRGLWERHFDSRPCDGADIPDPTGLDHTREAKPIEKHARPILPILLLRPFLGRRFEGC
jgi:hypothetical protein